jgi:hypothetical protein
MRLRHALFTVVLASCVGAYAAAPASAPAGSTALCKDGTYYSNAEKKGACKGHKGIKEWYGAESGKAADAGKSAKAEAAASAPAAHTADAGSAKKAPPQPAATAAPGGGAGKVWANEGTKVYHCEGDRWYGKTKTGEYLSEADAKAKGFKAANGKACS